MGYLLFSARFCKYYWKPIVKPDPPFQIPFTFTKKAWNKTFSWMQNSFWLVEEANIFHSRSNKQILSFHFSHRIKKNQWFAELLWKPCSLQQLMTISMTILYINMLYGYSLTVQCRTLLQWSPTTSHASVANNESNAALVKDLWFREQKINDSSPWML